MYSTGLDIWSVKVVDLERLSVDMNFKLIIMRAKTSFCSDRYQFTVVMPNLNYDVPQDFEGNETMFELERTRMQIILHYLETNREKISSIAAKLLKVEIKTASRLLLKAEKLDILKSFEKIKDKVYFRE